MNILEIEDTILLPTRSGMTLSTQQKNLYYYCFTLITHLLPDIINTSSPPLTNSYQPTDATYAPPPQVQGQQESCYQTLCLPHVKLQARIHQNTKVITHDFHHNLIP